MKILVVEDEFISRNLLLRLLSKNAEVDLAVNGQEAITAFETALLGNIRYDLVCLDIKMPDIDGSHVLLKIREIETYQGIEGLDRTKVIMTTAITEPTIIMRSFTDQADGYITKPISKKKLTEQLELIGLA